MSDTNEASSSTSLSFWYWLFMPACAGLIYLTINERAHGQIWPVGFLALLGYVLLSGLVWRIGDWLRIEMMPEVFFSSGFMDTVRTRVFWAIGPQVVGLILLATAGCIVVVHWGIPMKAVASPNAAPEARSVAQTQASHSLDGDASDHSAPSARMDCADPNVLALVRDELHGSLIMNIQMTHGIELGLAQIRQMVLVTLSNPSIYETERLYVVCSAIFDRKATGAAARYGIGDVHDKELTYWIQRDASGNMQVGVGD